MVKLPKLEIVECEQGTDEWFQARAGIITASRFADVMAKTPKGNADGATRKKYLYQLAGEILTGEVHETYKNNHMDRGRVMEAAAREDYIFWSDVDIDQFKQIGFAKRAYFGCSPDHLIGDNGVLEIKTALPSIMIDLAESGTDFPSEHKPQCQGALLVLNREFVDLKVYWPKMPNLTYRAYRDEPYIKNLRSEIDRFRNDLLDLVERMKARR